MFQRLIHLKIKTQNTSAIISTKYKTKKQCFYFLILLFFIFISLINSSLSFPIDSYSIPPQNTNSNDPNLLVQSILNYKNNLNYSNDSIINYLKEEVDEVPSYKLRNVDINNSSRNYSSENRNHSEISEIQSKSSLRSRKTRSLKNKRNREKHSKYFDALYPEPTKNYIPETNLEPANYSTEERQLFQSEEEKQSTNERRSNVQINFQTDRRRYARENRSKNNRNYRNIENLLERDENIDNYIPPIVEDTGLNSYRQHKTTRSQEMTNRNNDQSVENTLADFGRRNENNWSSQALDIEQFAIKSDDDLERNPKFRRHTKLASNRHHQSISNDEKNFDRDSKFRRHARATSNNNHQHNNRSKVWCPGHDVATRAYLAKTLFEGQVRSMSSPNKRSTYAVTFEVKYVYKSQTSGGYGRPLLKNETVRLHFAHGKQPNCDALDAAAARTGPVRAHLKPDRTYLVFVERVGPHNYTALGEPVLKNNRNVQAVHRVLSGAHFLKPTNVLALDDQTVKPRTKLKLICKIRGFPPPRVTWLKDGRELASVRRIRTMHKRRQSQLVISKARLEDSGRYECRAKGVFGPAVTKSAIVKVIDRTENTTWSSGSPCPMPGENLYCLNGGTCLFFQNIGEPACRCAEGFNGQRCETKEVMTQSTYATYSCSSKYLC